jgi:hypothetical protein
MCTTGDRVQVERLLAEDWGFKNNMNWEDVKEHAEKFKHAPEPDYQEGWVNGAWEVV